MEGREGGGVNGWDGGVSVGGEGCKKKVRLAHCWVNLVLRNVDPGMLMMR